jgi:hypothetical protein
METIRCPFCNKFHLPNKPNCFDLSEKEVEPGLYRIEHNVDVPEKYLKKIEKS